jgi:hypothetical protein
MWINLVAQILEKMAWEALKTVLNIEKHTHSMGNLKFSWVNRKKGLNIA